MANSMVPMRETENQIRKSRKIGGNSREMLWKSTSCRERSLESTINGEQDTQKRCQSDWYYFFVVAKDSKHSKHSQYYFMYHWVTLHPNPNLATLPFWLVGLSKYENHRCQLGAATGSKVQQEIRVALYDKSYIMTVHVKEYSNLWKGGVQHGSSLLDVAVSMD